LNHHFVNGPTYAPQFFTLSIGFSPQLEDMHFTSDKFLVRNVDALQKYELRVPQIGGYVRLDLYYWEERNTTFKQFALYSVLRDGLNIILCYGNTNS